MIQNQNMKKHNSCISGPQLVAMAVKVNAPHGGWYPVPFTMFPFSNVALNLLPFAASNVQVLLPLSISPLTISMTPCTLSKIGNQKPR